MNLTLWPADPPVWHGQSFSVHGHPGELRSGCPYAEHHELVGPVLWCREDSCHLVVSIADVSVDVGKHDFVSCAVWYGTFKPRTEGDVWRDNFCKLRGHRSWHDVFRLFNQIIATIYLFLESPLWHWVLSLWLQALRTSESICCKDLSSSHLPHLNDNKNLFSQKYNISFS